jgi:hypothetical protein
VLPPRSVGSCFARVLARRLTRLARAQSSRAGLSRRTFFTERSASNWRWQMEHESEINRPRVKRVRVAHSEVPRAARACFVMPLSVRAWHPADPIHPLILHLSNAPYEKAAHDVGERAAEARRVQEARRRSPHPQAHGALSEIPIPGAKARANRS